MAGFIRGILWGGVVAVGGLAVASQLGPKAAPETAAPIGQTDMAAIEPPAAIEPAAEPVAESPAPVVAEATQPEPAAPEPVAPEPVSDAPAEPLAPATPAAPVETAQLPELPNPSVVSAAPVGQVQVDAGEAPAAPTMAATPAPETVAPSGLAEPEVAGNAIPAPEAPQEAPEQPVTEAPGAEMASAGLPDSGLGAVTNDIAMAPVAQEPAAPELPMAESAPLPLELPPPPAPTPAEEALMQPAPEDAAPVTPIEPAEPPATVARPVPGLSDQAPGVITGRLPRIGDAPAAEADLTPAPEAADPTAMDETLPPLQRFARVFENPEQKPLFAILLVDTGADVNREDLAALELPLSIVIDPLAENAAEHAEIWRRHGQEVVLSAESLPEGATAGDLEQIFQALAERLPEAVAVIDPTGGIFQNDRQMAAQIVAILAGQGRGLVTFDQGLNAADQVARRDGLPTTTIFRRIDLENASGPAVKRYLDRAVFRAAQDGHVAVLGELRPEIVEGLLEWSVEGRASTVAVAPISALLVP